MNRRWICNDVWMDILPSFDHAQLGLKMALLSDRFDVLVDKHFDGKSELTIWKAIEIREGIGMPKLSVDCTFVDFPLPDRQLPNKIRFNEIRIEYINYSVIEFLRSNKQIWDRSGTNLELYIEHCDQSIWDVLDRQIWPFFATNIRHLGIAIAFPCLCGPTKSRMAQQFQRGISPYHHFFCQLHYSLYSVRVNTNYAI